MNKQKILILSGAVGLLIISVVVGILWNKNLKERQVVSMEEPVDIVSDFYNEWLRTTQATSTNPYQEGLHQSPLLSEELRTRLQDMQESQDPIDPVLCQSIIPEKIAMRIVSQNENETEILVTARKSVSTSTQQAIVKVLKLYGGWYIDSITCSPGEFPPEREFTFAREGDLLKSVPAPYNPDYWHIVFEENGKPGHAAPLLFDAQSMCHQTGGDKALCDPNTFQETAKVYLQGEMTEAGIKVKFIEFKK